MSGGGSEAGLGNKLIVNPEGWNGEGGGRRVQDGDEGTRVKRAQNQFEFLK